MKVRKRTIDHTTQVDVINEAVRSSLLDTHTCIPCTVNKVDGDSTVEVRIAVKRMFDIDEDEYEEREYLPITGVPIMFLSAGVYSVTYPVVAGDEGLILFSERDIQEFIKLGSTTPPANLRKHALEDAIFIPTRLSDAKRLPNPGAMIAKASDNSSVTTTPSSITVQVGENTIVIDGTNITLTTGANVITMVDGLTLFDGAVQFNNGVTIIGNTSIPNADITMTSGQINMTNGDIIVTNGQVKETNIRLGTHKHSTSGDDTGGPIP